MAAVDWPDDDQPVRVTVEPGIQVVVHELGAGSPLLLLPGLGADHIAFARNVRALAERHLCLVVDPRGIGASDPLVGPGSMAVFADDAAAVIAARASGPAHVLGVSMGGMVAQHLALRHPDRVRTLVLGCTHPGGAAAVLPDPAVTRDLLGGGARDPVSAYRNACRVMYGAAFQRHHPEVVEAAIAWRARHLVSGRTFRVQQEAIRHHATDGELAAIAAPTLVLHGSEDRVVPIANGERLAARIPRATLTQFAGLGHLFFQEDPVATDRVLREWLAACDPQA